MKRVIVKPLGATLEVEDGETIFEAARRLGWRWPTVCGGHAQCKACTLEVRSGVDSLTPMSEPERRSLEETYGATVSRSGQPLRLACRAQVTGDQVTIFKRGVRANSAGNHSGSDDGHAA